MREEELRRLEKAQKIMAAIDGIKETVDEARNVISEKDNIGRGNPEWGAPTDRDVYIIRHHKEESPIIKGKEL